MIKAKKRGITFIGMPSSGKSVTGRVLAQKLGYNHVDLDILIKEKEGKHHHLVLQEIGDKMFEKLEEKYALELDFENLIFSPGGSIIFSPEAMKKIKDESLVIYLGISKEEIERRLGENLHKDGIVGLETKGLSGIIEERRPLYEKYSDLYVDTTGLSKEKVVEKVLEKINNMLV